MKGFKGLKRFTLSFCAAFILAGAFAPRAFAPAAFAGEYFPVLIGGVLVGGFDEGGEWREAPDSVTVGGSEVSLYEVEGDEALMKRFEDEEFVLCETPLIVQGRRLAYWSPDGKEGEGTVNRVSIHYMGESAGAAALDVGIEGDEPDWTKLIVGVAAG